MAQHLGRRLVGGVLLLLLAGQAVFLISRSDPLDDLRTADRLFATGRYYEALHRYQQLNDQAPQFAIAYARRGLLHVVRAEPLAAGHALSRAIGLGIGGVERDLVRLAQAELADDAGQSMQAAQLRAQVADTSPLAGLRTILTAEGQIRHAEYAAAERTFTSALGFPLPMIWRQYCFERLALLQAAIDPAGALATLQQASQRPWFEHPPTLLPYAAVLLAPQPVSPQALAAALAADPAQRPQLLGQLYLDAGFFALALQQFEQAADTAAGALSAATFIAYTQLRADDPAGAHAALAALAERFPGDIRLHVLAALAALGAADLEQADIHLATAAAIEPDAAALHAARAAWYSRQGEYVAAAAELTYAVQRAPLAEQGAYALALARFYVDTTLRACEAGRPAAEVATGFLPRSATAWSTLAAAEMACADAAAATAAARRALAVDPADPAAHYYLGRALALAGEHAAARSALIAAADAAPASVWRERAEAQITLVP